MITSTARRADIDWLRIGAFGVLILYHVGLVYAPWDWHVNSLHRVDALQYVALASNPWRLSLLFLISGAALRFMTVRRRTPEVVGARMARLVPPLLFGILVLVPPQAWLEALDKGWWTGGFALFWLKEFSFRGLADGVPLNHLWFILYIGVYSLVTLALLGRDSRLAKAESLLEKAFKGWGLVLVPMAYLAACRLVLFPIFGQTNHLPNDWYNHAMSLGLFALGFVLVGRDDIWRRFEALRWPLLATALAALVTLIFLDIVARESAGAIAARRTVFAIDQWASLIAILGFASRHLRDAEGPARRYLTNAIFPCYLAHQTLLVIAAFILKPLALPIGLEATLLVGVTLGGSLLVYEGVRRVGPLRPLWGLKPEAPKVATPPRAAT
ncbi:acyltransferase family protein [Phenylobacterium sp.]|uniref:acyltransferase family protein n=1 Tax=Phenylobacterium sp. TaxID=1871053 RepID=UPI00272FA21B|nr:acyltransferase family protein [Phenylobacterium sp.]MDP1617946.1 acyltransferase family protein [Phenylobacterium sp.]MDP1989210.1 acyltransferase family protein [Phenylobacterium sp.]